MILCCEPTWLSVSYFYFYKSIQGSSIQHKAFDEEYICFVKGLQF